MEIIIFINLNFQEKKKSILEILTTIVTITSTIELLIRLVEFLLKYLVP